MSKPDVSKAVLTLQKGVTAADCKVLRELLSDLLSPRVLDIQPLTRAVLLLGDPALKAVQHSFSAPDGTYAIQESQRFTAPFDHPLIAGTQVVLLNESDSLAARYTFQLIGADAEMETRVRFLTPITIRAMSAPKLQPRMIGQEAITLSSLPLSAACIATYVKLANDPNPLHVDAGAARTAGFGDVIAPGMLLCALAEAAFVHVHPNKKIQELRARFLSPALVETSVQVIVTAPSGQKIRVFVVSETHDIHAIVDIFTA